MADFVKDNCCRPSSDWKCSKKLKPVSNSLREKLPKSVSKSVDKVLKICTSCYIRINSYNYTEEPSTRETTPEAGPSTTIIDSGSSVSRDSESSGEARLKRKIALTTLNTVLPDLGLSPIYESRLSRQTHQQNKMIKLSSEINTDIQPIISQADAEVDKSKLYDEMISQLKEKFDTLDTFADKIQLLTVLPKSVSIKYIADLFNTTHHIVRKAKELQTTNGVFSKPDPKIGKRITEEVEKCVLDHYNDDEVSRVMPGKNDCITIRNGKDKTKVQKRLMMSTLKECYEGYKTKYENVPSKKIGFSKFAMLRPKYCVQPGSSGTHSVCVCTIHQNVKLMIFGANLQAVTKGKLSDYKSYIDFALCPTKKPECFMLTCIHCPGLQHLQSFLEKSFQEENFEGGLITFNQWVSTDRCDLETFQKTLDDFLDYFIVKLKKLIPHFFISSQQSKFIKEKKNNLLQNNELLVQCDFSENYSFVLQNEAQGYHWNNKQATIHPFTVYYRDINEEVKHYSYIIISECLKHDSVAVHLFIEKFILFIKTKFSVISKIFYVSDGAASQYKNKKNFINVLNHRNDFGIDCEWHFHATSHGKGPCDGLGGILKRKAARDSLTHEYKSPITTPREMFDWAKTLSTDMHFDFSTNAEHEAKEQALEERFKNLKTINGTQSYHAYIPHDLNTLHCKTYSNAEDYKINHV